MKVTEQYHNLLKRILAEGVWRDDPNRKGTKRLQIPFSNMLIDLREGFPAITTKKLWWKGVVAETLWLLKGNTNIKELVDQGVNIWNKDAYNYFLKSKPTLMTSKNPGEIKEVLFEKYNKKHQDLWLGNILQGKSENKWLGDIGRMYGVQWRKWAGTSEMNDDLLLEENEIDQLSNIIQQIKDNPLSSNHTIFGDNPADRENQALPCCMNYMQFSCEPYDENDWNNIKENGNYYLDLSINYRSWDTLLGGNWNIAQYALILSIIAKITNTVPRYLNINSQNVHLYDNQIEAAKEQLERDYNKYELPQLNILKTKDYWDNFNLSMLGHLDVNDFKLENYNSYPKLDKQPEMLSYKL